MKYNNKLMEILHKVIDIALPYGVVGAGLAVYSSNPALGTAYIGAGFGGPAVYHTGKKLWDLFHDSKERKDSKQNLETKINQCIIKGD